MKFGVFKFSTVLLALVSTLLYTSVPASATATSESSVSVLSAPNPQMAMGQLANTTETLEQAEQIQGEEADSYLAQARGEVEAVGTHVQAKEGESVAFADGRVSRLDDGTTLAVFPLVGGSLTSSALTVSFSPAGDAYVHEILLREISSTSGSVEFWSGGEKVVDQVVESNMPSTQGWSEFIDCLNSSGAASWVVTAITIACAAACAVTAGAACIACIAAAAGTTGGVVGYCINEGW
ncbi:hypothetical protein A6A08_21965 [Nocardiopsis sp. TSRI0078]|uniref:hypothetical protein n=1 Tax=unclassified Nocardiopsis TaxID=2649073 RepID=UPI0009396825|nr:hypothetical protein [Nocardiopsis sp. TSRI0078]OKI21041.1 hypothetical protein A6A08_21965 [Nocardiopsis sp. TSRI0078]